ncbi:hypothetical protein ACFLZW_07795, partial [Chloroflexota bacterium]
IDNKIIAERSRLLSAIPACEHHGDECVPHAIEWVEKMIKLEGRHQTLVEHHRDDHHGSSKPETGHEWATRCAELEAEIAADQEDPYRICDCGDKLKCEYPGLWICHKCAIKAIYDHLVPEEWLQNDKPNYINPCPHCFVDCSAACEFSNTLPDDTADFLDSIVTRHRYLLERVREQAAIIKEMQPYEVLAKLRSGDFKYIDLDPHAASPNSVQQQPEPARLWRLPLFIVELVKMAINDYSTRGAPNHENPLSPPAHPASPSGCHPGARPSRYAAHRHALRRREWHRQRRLRRRPVRHGPIRRRTGLSRRYGRDRGGDLHQPCRPYRPR